MVVQRLITRRVWICPRFTAPAGVLSARLATACFQDYTGAMQ